MASVAQDALSKYIKDSVVDHTNLERWSWIHIEGEPGHVTRVVTAYAPTGSRASGNATYYK